MTAVPPPTRGAPLNRPVTVTLVVPCLNERDHIERCLRSLLEGEYPAALLEVLVLDGMSTDGTRERLATLSREWPCICVLDNPGASKPKGLNLGIAAARGEVVMRIDAHAEYAANYISTLVRALLEYGVDNVGAVRRNLPRRPGTVAKCLARVLTHPFGVGNATYNTGVVDAQWTDIVYLFCARRSLFEEMGGFNERLSRGQDREFNLRLVRAGRRMLLVPGTECRYYVRSDLSSFAPWAIQAGLVPFQISRAVGRSLLSARNLVPALFVAGLATGLVFAVSVPWGWMVLAAVAIPYVTLATGVAVALAVREREPVFAIGMPVAFLLWHTCYGLGSLRGLAAALRPAPQAR